MAGLQGSSKELAEAVMMLDLARAETDNLWIHGELLVTDRLARFFLGEALKNLPVPVIQCERYRDDLEFFVWEVFGAETATPRRGFQPWRGLLENYRDTPMVWVDGVMNLGKECFDFLSDVIAKRSFCKWGGSEPIPLNCRWIVTSGYDESWMTVDAWRWFLRRLNPLWFFIPALEHRPDDITSIANAQCVESEKKTGFKKKFSRRSLEMLLGHDWPGGHIQLENVIQRAIQQSRYRPVVEPWDLRLAGLVERLRPVMSEASVAQLPLSHPTSG